MPTDILAVGLKAPFVIERPPIAAHEAHAARVSWSREIKFSLRTRDPAVAKVRTALANAHLEPPAASQSGKRHQDGVFQTRWNGYAARVGVPTGVHISDSAGAQMILDAIRKRWPWIKHLFADGAYDRRQLMDKAAFLDLVTGIVRRIDSEPGLKVLPRRWVVERTFGWLIRWRVLPTVRDYAQRIDVSEAMIHVAMGNLLLRRISH